MGFLRSALKRAKAFINKGRSGSDYIAMQKKDYELRAAASKVESGGLEEDYVVGSWREHDEWRDYETYLMKYVPAEPVWVALEYGCGPGRNIRRWSPRFARIDGVDISQRNFDNANRFLAGQIEQSKWPNLYLTDGASCGSAPRNSYDFVFSTICLQHICVHKVRFSILRSLFECAKPGARLSLQMGYGESSEPPPKVSYYANHYAAVETNGRCDTQVTDPAQLERDLTKIGFTDFESWIRPVGPGDHHPNWIFFTAVKPPA
jgi:SAM-dependent methyltransferase